ncbi:MAG: helix-turn-helix domain-containing protein [Comamonas sp.]
MNARSSIKEQIQRVREEAIVTAVNRLLATKGYDAMTVDEVAAEAGMAKASLYKLFTSKEELAGAAMVGVLDRALGFVDGLRSEAQEAAQAGQPVSALDQLKAVVRWAMRTQLEGEMPSLPAQNSNLSASLQSNDAYMDRLIALSNRLSIWITEAQTSGQLPRHLPTELVLYTLFARACDPVLGLLKESGQYSDDQIIDWVTSTTFYGLAVPSAAPAAR